ncbi:MAG: ATP-binding protein [Pseudomonadota bacterium]
MLAVESFPPATDADAAAVLPPQPKSVRETGLPLQLIVELIAKAIFIGGKSHLPVLTTRLHLSINVLREALEFMVAEHLVEVAWRGESDIDVQYQLTAGGKQRASAWLDRCPYIGPAPVTLEAYRAMVERQAGHAPLPCADELAAEFADDFLSPAVQRMLGAAMHAGRTVLLHGPSGSGKSMLAHRLGTLLQGVIAVPHALAVGQEIVQVYDALLHRAPSPQHLRQLRQLQDQRSSDPRWLLCQRPVVALDSDLSADMLDLQPDSHSGCYRSPPQLKANNGMLIVDDLGRRSAEPLLAGAGAGAQPVVAGGRLPLQRAVPLAAGVRRQPGAGSAVRRAGAAPRRLQDSGRAAGRRQLSHLVSPAVPDRRRGVRRCRAALPGR